ncbi:hypothetical protein FHW69_002194 [Luteibacter sp. Sphag1AF]|uniref:DUF3011 domain-containing protein n=1 Tax=Luteibacter sp. Sphag1AF TaxID=2587031 RepID=UPI001854A667|nr:DUF3011 domain-containing protein [Luteibacter sp. Sphag1AF]MBB3227571.1 hypothetical protein [Luteibacter sp. Sphag1AF]
MRGFLGVVAMAAMALVAGAGMGLPSVAHAQGQWVYCASNDGRFSRCSVPWADAVVVRQESDTRCVRGQTWGFDRNGIWVDRGCRAQFAAAGGRGDWGPGPGRPPYGGGGYPGNGGGPGWGDGYGRPNRETVIECNSSRNRFTRCDIDIGRGGARLIRRTSDSRCDEGQSWGWDRRGIWVNDGCRAQFGVDAR